MTTPENDLLRRHRAELTRLMEPGDLLGGLLVSQLGPSAAHALITSGASPETALQQRIGAAAADHGLGPRQRNLGAGLSRWRTRLPQLHGEKDLRAAELNGGTLLIPEDPMWPAGLQALGLGAPLGLWLRSASATAQNVLMPAPGRTVAIVGAREATDYGLRVAFEMAEELASHGVTVVSGAAYGIDAAAHRGALRGAGRATGSAPDPHGDQRVASENQARPFLSTAAVLAGGVDKLYPAGHDRLLRQIMQEGVVLSEMPPGSAPQRHRFLQRNRLIAGLADVVVVVEARRRSGALSTAHHALSIGRAVGAVPGSVDSAASAGCHRLLRETPAQLITDALEAVELITALPSASTMTGESAVNPHQNLHTTAWDALDEVEKRLYDALPHSGYTTAGRLSAIAGLPIPQVYSGLSRMQRRGLVAREAERWKRLSPQRTLLP